MSSTVVAFVPDLMDRSKLQAAVGSAVVFAGSLDQLVELVHDGVDVVVVDLSRPGVLDALEALGRSDRPAPPIVGFGSHVDRQVLESARRAGCRALARSAFFADPRAALGWQ